LNYIRRIETGICNSELGRPFSLKTRGRALVSIEFIGLCFYAALNPLIAEKMNLDIEVVKIALTQIRASGAALSAGG
jgi:hypothetical protein